MGEGNLWFYLEQRKNTPQNQKYKPPSVSGTDVAQFPTVLKDFGGNAENQASG